MYRHQPRGGPALPATGATQPWVVGWQLCATMADMNLLFISCDQWRGDALSCAGHPALKTPNLDILAADGVSFAKHFGQSAPCSPGRASLYTGLYAMNHR